jgi:hypothetical protein
MGSAYFVPTNARITLALEKTGKVNDNKEANRHHGVARMTKRHNNDQQPKEGR